MYFPPLRIRRHRPARGWHGTTAPCPPLVADGILHVLTGFGVDPASELPLADWQRQLGLPVEGDGP